MIFLKCSQGIEGVDGGMLGVPVATGGQAQVDGVPKHIHLMEGTGASFGGSPEISPHGHIAECPATQHRHAITGEVQPVLVDLKVRPGGFFVDLAFCRTSKQ